MEEKDSPGGRPVPTEDSPGGRPGEGRPVLGQIIPMEEKDSPGGRPVPTEDSPGGRPGEGRPTGHHSGGQPVPTIGDIRLPPTCLTASLRPTRLQPTDHQSASLQPISTPERTN